MSEMRAILAETASRLFAAHCTRDVSESAARGEWPASLWQAVEDAGLARAAIAEDKGGAGADLGDVMTILRASGRHAAPVPLAETMLASWLLSESGLAVPAGPLAVAPVEREELSLAASGDGWRLSGEAHSVPWAQQCGALAVLARAHDSWRVALVERAQATTAPGRNLAGEPRDHVLFKDAPVDARHSARAAIDAEGLWRRGTLSRMAQMAGALEAVLDATVRHANERVQFGRPIAKFQAVQQQIAVLAANIAAASAAADAAVAAAESGAAAFAIAAAKARINEAASLAAAIAHQIHGAMGFTREHALHLYTSRLWSWREEFGDESYWWAWLGRETCRVGGDGLWPFLTAAR